MFSFAHGIIETAKQPMLIIGEGLKVVAANSPFHQSFQTTAAEVAGQCLFEIDEGKWDYPQLRTLPQDLLASREAVVDFECDYDSAMGGSRRLLIQARYVDRDDGSRMILLAIEDKTEFQRERNDLIYLNKLLEQRIAERTAELDAANRKLRDSNQELIASNQELESFCYSISHDLRVPLRAIDGFSNALSESYNKVLDDQAQHYLRRIRYGTQRMGQLIDDLLKLSRMTRDEMKLRLVDLSAIAETIVADLEQQLPVRKVEVTIHPRLTAWADRHLIQIVLENLLGNAWKFTGQTENAAIEFGRDPLGFFVRDNGAGFDPALAYNMFGAFQRFHSSRDFPGTGIGLATVRRVIHRHGGNIRAEGAAGLGATFYFTLPEGEKRQ